MTKATSMRIGIVGAGRIGGNAARQLMPAPGQTAAAFNAARMPGARYTKSFNTLTSQFQEETAGRTGPQRVVQWLAGDDARPSRSSPR